MLASDTVKPTPVVEYNGRLYFRRYDGKPGAPLRDDGLIDWDYLLDRPCTTVYAPAEIAEKDEALLVGTETNYDLLILPPEEMWN